MFYSENTPNSATALIFFLEKLLDNSEDLPKSVKTYFQLKLHFNGLLKVE